jgi:hypothetical protein
MYALELEGTDLSHFSPQWFSFLKRALISHTKSRVAFFPNLVSQGRIADESRVSLRVRPYVVSSEL